MLLFKSVSPEDMGEIKFTAEKASSVAKLKVKGKPGCNAVHVKITTIASNSSNNALYIAALTF